MFKSKAKQLSDKFGGKWKYDGIATWWCDDEKRHVSRVCNNFYDDFETTPLLKEYILYGDGTPRHVFFSGKLLNFKI
jgi:hypothetical protein